MNVSRESRPAPRTILLITYHYAPEATVGALRPTKFATYLPQFGWRPAVVSVRTKYYQTLDPSQVVPDFPIARAGTIINPRDLYLRLRDLPLQWWRRRPSPSKDEVLRRAARTSWDEKDVVANTVLAGIRRLLVSLLYLPDDRLGWVPPAVLSALRLARILRPAAILTSGPPHSAHLVGLLVTHWCRTKWVADFRDAWSLEFRKPAALRSPFSDRAEAWMERRVVERAAVVLSATQRMTEEFRALYPHLSSERFHTITNGFDPLEFAHLKPAYDAAFTISHVGSLYFRSSPLPFLKALAALVQSGRIGAHELRVRFAGDWDDGNDAATMAATLGLSSVVHVSRRVSHEEALQYMIDSDLLLLFAQDVPHTLPSKLFEYLASGADILAFASEGMTADLLAKLGRGTTVQPDNIPRIVQALESSYAAFRRGATRSRPRPAPSDPALAAFDRRELTGALAGHLDRICR
jgi:glycosyltransferase involved in cell wall biosynthesis